jgi:3-deoxy-D-manno-octulosonic-acid transferase
MSLILLRIYAWFATLSAAWLRGHLRHRALIGKEIPSRLGERRGYDQTRRPKAPVIWLHAASVGETLSILPVIEILLRRSADLTVLVTTGTVTSATLLTQRARGFDPDRRVLHRFVPLDVPRWTNRFVEHWRPDAAGFVESEIWPNLLLSCRYYRVPLMLINARLSDASARRWHRMPGVARRLFGLFNLVQAQSNTDAERLAALGAHNVSSPGNLKFATPALPADQAELARLQHLLAGRPVWLAASTHPGEERIVGAVHLALAERFPNLLTIVVPRHPERGRDIATDLAVANAPVDVTRRAQGEDPPANGIWVADTLGELGLFYRLAPIAFVGRSLAVGGGQNPIEAARLGCAICTGPLTSNFDEPVRILQSAGALTVVHDAADLAKFVASMLQEPERRAAMAQAGIAAATGVTSLPDLVADTLIALMGEDQ